MIGEDLGITGLVAIEDFPEGNPIQQILFMNKLLEKLKKKDKIKYEKRIKYINL